MKVLIFMPQFHQLGGAERSVLELAVEMNKRGIHTDIMSMYTRDILGVEELQDKLISQGIPVIHYLGMKVHPSISSLVPAIIRLRKIVCEQRYSVVETSLLSPSVIATWAFYGLQIAHLVGIRHVYKQHRENSKQHNFFRFSVRLNNKIRYYSISDFAREEWVKYSGTLPEHSRTVHNSIPEHFFNVKPDKETLRDELGIPSDAKIAIYVGRFTAYKGIDTILSALGPELISNNLYLLFVGSADLSVNGTDEMLKKMHTQIELESWQSVVRFLGPREDVDRLMASADIFVHATRTEAFGRTLAEALAIGIPVVSTNVEAVPEVLSGTDSILVPVNDSDALRNAVLTTLNRTPRESYTAKERGRARAESFRIAKRTDAMITLFEDVLSHKF